MSEAYENAKKIAEKLVELETTRKNAVDEMKILKDELLETIEQNSIDSYFEFSNGIVFLETSTTFKIADGLKDETEITSKQPEKLSQDFLDGYFKPDLKLNKTAKKALVDGDQDLLAVVVPEDKTKIKIVVK